MLWVLHHMTPDEIALIRANPELARAVAQANIDAAARALALALQRANPNPNPKG